MSRKRLHVDIVIDLKQALQAPDAYPNALKMVPGVVLGTPTPHELAQAKIWVKMCQPFYKQGLPGFDSVNWDDGDIKGAWRRHNDMANVLTGTRKQTSSFQHI
jgi:hypothetical protein